MTQTRQPVAYGYCRATTNSRRSAGVPLDEQRQRIETYFAAELAPKGFAWGGFFEDGRASWRVDLRFRPAGARLSAAVERCDVILCAQPELVGRSERALWETVGILQARGVSVLFLDVPADLTQLRRDLASARMREAIAELQARGVAVGRHPPYGFKFRGRGPRRKLVLCARERQVARKFLGWHRAGHSYERILVHLLRCRVKTKYGGDYSKGTLFRHMAWELELQRKEARERLGASAQ